jgi:hypothetical protein
MLKKNSVSNERLNFEKITTPVEKAPARFTT